jgi:hypothetical protein
MDSPLETLSGISLYLFSPFFFHPLKFFSFLILPSGDYEESYTHFRRDHQGAMNLLFHCVCLLLQVSFNFGFLSLIDERFETGKYMPENPLSSSLGDHPLSTITLILWSLVLLLSRGIPLKIKALSLATVLSIFVLTQPLIIDPRAFAILIQLQPFVDTLAYLYVLKKPNTIVNYGVVVSIRLALHSYLWNYYLGVLQFNELSTPIQQTIKFALPPLLCFLAHKPFLKPLSGIFGPFLLFGHIISILFATPLPLLWGFGFISTVLQGVAHRHTKEAPTLPGLANIRFELGHTTYFPALLLESCWESTFGEKKRKKER